jgi:hypothetical protein
MSRQGFGQQFGTVGATQDASSPMLRSGNHGGDTHGYLVSQSFSQRPTNRQGKVFVEGTLHENHSFPQRPLIVAGTDRAIEVPVLTAAMNAIRGI